MNQKTLKVIVYSDYICPFCYIGFHRIEKLKEKYPLEIEWKPFELHPEIPREGIITEKLSIPRGYLEIVRANVKRLADEDGITLKFTKKVPNSRLALFFSEFAKIKGKFAEFHRLVFVNYWKEGKDIGDLSLLLVLAESLGFRKAEILSYIKSDEPVNKLDVAKLELRIFGIHGVPTFFIEDEIVFGAQPYYVFEDAIDRVLKKI